MRRKEREAALQNRKPSVERRNSSTEKSCEAEIGERGEWFADVKLSSLQVKVVQVVSLKNKEGGVGVSGG